jgi:hypothetical protein
MSQTNVTTILFVSFCSLAVTDAHAQPAAASIAVGCDDALKAAFHPDANTQVLLVHNFKQGEVLQLPGSPADGGRGGRGAGPARAATDVCVVKLLVGPGNPGPANAPSTSA